MANVEHAFEWKETSDAVLMEDVRDLINRFWGLHPSQRYVPCPNPSNLERKDLQLVSTQEYFVSPKIDGVRMFLLMGALESDGRTYAVLIDRSYRIFPLPIQSTDNDLFDGTLLDGEITQTIRGKTKYTVFDAITIKGYDQKRNPFNARQTAYEKLIKTLVPPQGLAITSKHWHPRSDAVQVWVENEQHCDGLILQPAKGLIKAGILNDVFKWKPVNLQSIDFYVSKKDRGVVLECGEGPNIINANELNCYIHPEAQFPVPLTDKRQVMECLPNSLEEDRIYFEVTKARPDKVYANDARVVLSTLRAIQEDITVEELCD